MLTFTEIVFDRFLFPKECLCCGKIGKYFCPDCIQNIFQKELICPNCTSFAVGGETHQECYSKFSLNGLWSLAAYQDPIKKAIQKLKYRFITQLAEELIDLLINYWINFQPVLLEEIKKDRGENWVIVPTPLHKLRENWRGFNQSALLGKILAKKLGLEYQELLIKIKNTKPQAGLLKSDRVKNLNNAFKLATSSSLLDKKVILLDDVWTTGSTLKECARVLKATGAKKVWGLTIAR